MDKRQLQERLAIYNEMLDSIYENETHDNRCEYFLEMKSKIKELLKGDKS